LLPSGLWLGEGRFTMPTATIATFRCRAAVMIAVALGLCQPELAEPVRREFSMPGVLLFRPSVW